MDKARDAVDWFKQTLGADNFFLELQNHGIAEQAKVNRHLIKWAKEFGLKLVATNDVHYIEKSHSHAHDCLICIGTQTQFADTKRMRYEPEQFYLRTAEEMKARFADTPEAVTNTLEVAEKCNLEIEFGKLHYPVFHPPEHFTREGYLRQWLAEGLFRRYTIHAKAEGKEFVVTGIDDPKRLPTFDPTKPKRGWTPPSKAVLDRFNSNSPSSKKPASFPTSSSSAISSVKAAKWASRAWRAAAPPVRWSLTCWKSRTWIPIRYGLLFERFLNPERVNPPDIDIDFADDRRADVIEYVREKYGKDSVAQIITFGTMGAKSVVRDVGRVMGLSYGDCDRLAKMIPFDLKMDA